MNARIASSSAAVAAFALLGVSAAFAQQAPTGDNYDPVPAFSSSQSRAAVKAQVIAARADGSLEQVSDTYGVEQQAQPQAIVSTRSRAEVKAELLAARQRGDNLDVGDAS